MKKIRITALLLSMTLLFTTCLMFTGAGATTLSQDIATKNELESQLKALEEKRKQISAALTAARNDVAAAEKEVNLLYDEIGTYQEQVETLSTLVAEYSALAEAKEEEIDRLNEQMEKNYKLFKERLVFAQESGNMSYIDFLLGSTDLSDIISRSEVINDMLEYDRKIIQSLKEDREAIEKAKEEIDVALKTCKEKQEEYTAVLKILNQKRAELEARLKELKDNQAAQQAAYNRNQNSKKEIENRLDKVIQDIANKSQGSYSGDFIWPLPVHSPGWISQHFHSGHSGLDIAVGGWVNNGKIPALSIAAGTVVRVGSYWDWGNLVVVDHGGGYLSYYAHLDSISVSYGQKVSQGQQVGKIGSTGDSTGPHLHLVIYAPVGAGGASIRTDPMNYISYPR
ncbi:MAG: peptidoglycan DD-metalloendopeptidase family protein [Clostridia bacterium]|nr:peptidoglycan DD-metalloendopeptidase family protein [Clostridia bacterium]